MVQVPSATASSIPLTRLIAQSSRWNNRTVTALVVGVAIAAIAYVAYRLILAPLMASHRNVDSDDEVSESYIADFYPECDNALPDLPFDDIAAGLLRFHVEDLLPPELRKTKEPVFIECVYDGRTYFRQPLTPGTEPQVFIPELPLGKTVKLLIKHRDAVHEVNLPVKEEMTIYQLDKNQGLWEVRPHGDYSLEQLTFRQVRHNLDQPFSLSVSDDTPMNFLQSISLEPSCSFENRSALKTHIVFLKIIGRTNLDVTSYALPIAIMPHTIIDLPLDFLAASWKATYQTMNNQAPPNDVRLVLHGITDTFAEEVL